MMSFSFFDNCSDFSISEASSCKFTPVHLAYLNPDKWQVNIIVSPFWYSTILGYASILLGSTNNSSAEIKYM